VKVFPAPYLSVTGFLPHEWNAGVYEPTDREVSADGWADPSFSASWDIFEMLNPSIKKGTCPVTGKPLISMLDEEQFIKNPHLSVYAGFTAPVGRADIKDHTWVVPPNYQPGAGVYTGWAGMSYAQGIGEITPSLAMTYMFGGGENSVAYDAADSLSLSASAKWVFWYTQRGTLYSGFDVLSPLGKATRNGKELDGSDTRLVLWNAGVSLFAHKVWRTTGGVSVTVPVIEGGADEVKVGTGLSLFLIQNF